MSMPSYWFDPMVNTGPLGGSYVPQPAQSANQINTSIGMGPGGAGAQNQAVLNNNFNQFGTLTDYYSSLGASYGRATGGFGGAPGRVGTIGNPGTSNPGYLSSASYDPFIAGAPPIQHYGGYGGNQIFDPQRYLQQNPDVWKSGALPWEHYNQFGKQEGRQAPWSNIFNSSDYLAHNPDVAASGMDPTAHWFQYGQKEGRGGQTFNPTQYLSQNPDVFQAGADPWQHYSMYGQNEGRQGAWSEAFNPTSYLQHNPDVAAAGADPTAHWFQYGQNEGRQGAGGGDAFNPQEYLLQNRDVAAAGMDPLQHWMNYGYKEGRDVAFGGVEDADWSRYFSQDGTGRDAIAAAYLQTNPDVFDAAKASGRDPTAFGLEHLWNYGVGEGRTGFDNAGYLAQNPDVAAAGVNPFQHYVNYGYNEGRQGAWMGGGDDYWGRGYMASDDPYGYGDPTGVGGSGYGDGFGGYGSAESNPWGLPPGANVANPLSYFVYSDPGTNPWQDTRSAFYNDITSNPARMYDMAVRGYLELKRDPTGRQGVFEAMFNQKAARSVLDPLRADYFPHDPVKDRLYLQDYANTTATLRNNPELLAKLYGEIGRAYSSNLTHGATDWASGSVAANSANRSTETWKSPVEGERYFIKNIPNLYDGPAAGRANAAWLLGIQQQLPDYQWPQ